jgi:hypothetical protein
MYVYKTSDGVNFLACIASTISKAFSFNISDFLSSGIGIIGKFEVKF